MAKKIMKLTKNAAFYLGKCIWRPLVKDFMPNHHPPSDHYPRALTYMLRMHANWWFGEERDGLPNLNFWLYHLVIMKVTGNFILDEPPSKIDHFVESLFLCQMDFLLSQIIIILSVSECYEIMHFQASINLSPNFDWSTVILEIFVSD